MKSFGPNYAIYTFEVINFSELHANVTRLSLYLTIFIVIIKFIISNINEPSTAKSHENICNSNTCIVALFRKKIFVASLLGASGSLGRNGSNQHFHQLFIGYAEQSVFHG